MLSRRAEDLRGSPGSNELDHETDTVPRKRKKHNDARMVRIVEQHMRRG
jgi:hypothetical protein